jgi:hypothetical protein
MPRRKIQVDDKWYVLATFAQPEQPQVLKNDETFGMFDRFGDIAVLAPGRKACTTTTRATCRTRSSPSTARGRCTWARRCRRPTACW